MRLLFCLLTMLITALCVGIGLSYYVITSSDTGPSIRIGSWVSLPQARMQLDPYAHARLSRTGILPITRGEGMAFIATKDNLNHTLTGNCTYRIAGQTIPSRFWSLAAYDENNNLIGEHDGVYVLTGQNLLRRADGSFVIRISPHPQSGNWLPMPAKKRMSLIIRLYETTLFNSLDDTEKSLPTIAREGCDT